MKSFLKYLMPILFSVYGSGGTIAEDKANLIKDQEPQPSPKELLDANRNLIRGLDNTTNPVVEGAMPDSLGKTTGASSTDLSMDKIPEPSIGDEMLMFPTIDEIPPPTMDEIPSSPAIDTIPLPSGSEVTQPTLASDSGEVNTSPSLAMPSGDPSESFQQQEKTEEQKAKRVIAQNEFQAKAFQRAQQRQLEQHLAKQEAAESQERERFLQKQPSSKLGSQIPVEKLVLASQAGYQTDTSLTDEHGNPAHEDELKSEENQKQQ